MERTASVSRLTGFSATASTIHNEMGYRSDLIERPLAHAERDKVRASYNHTEYMDERMAMMQDWADFSKDPMCSTRNGAAFRKVTAST